MNVSLLACWLRWLENVINATRPEPSPAEQAYVLERIDTISAQRRRT